MSSVDCRVNYTRSLVVIKNLYGVVQCTCCTKSYISIHFIIMSIIFFQKLSMMNKTEVIGTYTELYITAFEFLHIHTTLRVYFVRQKKFARFECIIDGCITLSHTHI